MLCRSDNNNINACNHNLAADFFASPHIAHIAAKDNSDYRNNCDNGIGRVVGNRNDDDTSSNNNSNNDLMSKISFDVIPER